MMTNPRRYVRTPILSDKVIAYLESKGVKFATVEDCARAMIQIAARKEVNGKTQQARRLPKPDDCHCPARPNADPDR